ncbi:MAG: putative TPR repeat methyltransferase [Sulfurimonas sp.]|jgi:predicted TPR repeat methyltransferase|uniref:class I SAM-dependent DNA methyltransferase n=1 Tax=Sulfurimonas sp. TaxID=2022749 RepID=UPI0039E6EEC6
MVDNFKDKAQTWDKGSTRVNGAKTIADAISKNIKLQPHMKLMDFGVGTGLLGFEILPLVEKILGIDISQKMLEQLAQKNSAEQYIEPKNIDIIKNPLKETFDGMISSMTLHHVEDLELFFQTIYKNINANGFIAIADLEAEDGTFHSENTGVFHFGFNQDALCKVVTNAGFKDVKIENINTINKPHRDFGVFLLTAKRA